MSPGNIKKARASVITRPAVVSLSATRKLASSLRRLGADQETIDKLLHRPQLPRTSR
jgi:hypothetical protein